MSGLRERKKEVTRQALALAAIRLAVERGLENVLVEDIAAAAQVSPRTFNNYFTSKYEAICALAVDRAHRVGRALRERPAAENLWDAIRVALLTEYGGDLRPDPAWTKGVRLVTSAPALQGEYRKTQAQVCDALAEAIADRLGQAPDDLRPMILAGAVNTATEYLIDRWLDSDPPVRLASHVDGVLDELRTIVNAPALEPKENP